MDRGAIDAGVDRRDLRRAYDRLHHQFRAAAMTRNEALKIFYDMPWGAWARDQPGVFYAAETLHFIGLSLLLGALLLADLRLLGLWKNLKPAHVIHFVRFAAIGFVINLITGVVMFCADPYNYWNNWMFQLKVILILAAG